VVSRSCQVASQSEQPTFVAMTPIRPPRATAHAHHEEHIEGRQGAIGRSVVSEGPLDIPREVRKFRVISLSTPNRETEERTRTAYPCSSYECVVSNCWSLYGLARPAR
jgi:hypothetical protein